MSEQKMVPLADWDDPRVRIAYDMLCGDERPPNPKDHLEGYLARRIVGEIDVIAAPTAPAADAHWQACGTCIRDTTNRNGLIGVAINAEYATDIVHAHNDAISALLRERDELRAELAKERQKVQILLDPDDEPSAGDFECTR